MKAYSRPSCTRKLAGGHYCDGEVQGLVDSGGRWKPIDFQPVRELKDVPEGAARDAAIAHHNEVIKLEADGYRRIAQNNTSKTK